ncbi:MAG: extracellular solute-binding protein [Bosea sp.]|nr:extracellular solute-binding protein [Bosea sp. (in: a-proteobacteria)]
MINRRHFLAAGAALAAAGLVPAGRAFAATKLDVFTNSDANISDWLANIVKPAFEKAHPDYEVNVVIARNGGLDQVAQRALAALAAKADPQMDFAEQYDPNLPKGAIEAGLWVKFDDQLVPNFAHVNKAAIQSPYSMPYRGSQVLLAYDSTKVAADAVPKTWDALTAWIKANPGQFIYNRPDKGGSGKNFVVRAIHEANGRDPGAFTVGNYSKEEAEKRLAPAWAILNDLAPSLYEKGAYAAGNAASLQLLSNGVVSMVPIWSDMVLQGLAQGAVPETIKIVQLQDLALCGGFSASVIPTIAAHKEAALAFADFLLTEEIQTSVLKDLGGFPGVDWSHLPAALREEFAAVIPASIPTFPEGDWSTALNEGWYRNVAPTIARG